MRIATFNCNSVRARLDIVLDWLADRNPDVLALQETKVVDADFPARAFAERGYHIVFRGEKSYNGVAFVSKSPPGDVVFGFDDGRARPDGTRLVRARFGGVLVVNTYVPQGKSIDHPDYRYKLAWFGRLGRLFAGMSPTDGRLVWVGDLNVAPEAKDIHNASEQEEHVCYHKDVRKALSRVVRTVSFVDVFRKHHPEEGQYSFFDYRTVSAVRRNMGWRVDHVFAAPAMAERSRNAFIDLAPRMKEKPSDHTFVVADFE
jgi:exodeoxyribonuclease-3